MAVEHDIIGIQRLRDELADTQSQLKKQYDKTGRVTSKAARSEIERIAETWLVEYAGSEFVSTALDQEHLANLNVHFQRLLTLPEGTAKRSSYDSEIQPILKDFNAHVVVPLKQKRNSTQLLGGRLLVAQQATARQADAQSFLATAFVGHSFAPGDKAVNDCVNDTLREIGITVETGERPKAERISDKVRRLLEAQHVFVGVFTRRDKLSGKREWTTSPWVIDEKAYAFGKGKRLVLLKEEGVSSIGGIQGDYEFVEFSRSRLELLVINLLKLFVIGATGMRK